MKKSLAIILATMLLTSFVSCGNTQESSSESSSSTSEIVTEEEPTTELETIVTEIPTTKQSYVLPELDETYEDKNIIFKYSSKWEKGTEESLRNKAYLKINDDFEIKIFENDSEYSTNDEFIIAEEKEYKKKNKEYEIYETTNGNKLICYTEEATKSKKFFSSTSYISFFNYSPEYDELIDSIIDTVQVKDSVYQKNNPRVFSDNLDKTFDNEDISFKYSSEWEDNIRILEEYGYSSAEFIIDPLNEFQIKILVEPVTLDYSSNDEFIIAEEENFKKRNEEYEIFATDSGDKLIYYKSIDYSGELNRFRAYNGKTIWIDFKNYAPQYDDIIKKIIDTIDIKENFVKPVESPTDPPIINSTYSFEPFTISGNGSTVVRDVNIPAECVVYNATHNGTSNFMIDFYDCDDGHEFLINEIGNYSCTQIFNATDIDDSSPGMIEVDADGYWSITFSPVRAVVNNKTSTSFSGYGADITGAFKSTGNMVCTISHDGSSNFIVDAYELTENGGRELVANEIGEYNGQCVIRTKKDTLYFFAVDADGNWTIDVE